MNLESLSAEQRFSLSLGIAAALHVFLILAVGFTVSNSPARNNRSIEIVLEQVPAEQDPEEARYIAASAQLGSGSSEQENLPSARSAGVVTEAKGDSLQATAPVLPKSAKTAAVPELTQYESKRQVRQADQKRFDFESDSTQKPQRIQELAKLISELADEQRDYAQRPRTLRLSTVSAKSDVAAHYMRIWVDEVEHTGNLHYPDEARRDQLSGDVMMEVTIGADGRLLQVDVRKRSGQQVLDDAAIRSVRLAAPFAPFPSDLRESYDRLAITRTWSFKAGSLHTQADSR